MQAVRSGAPFPLGAHARGDGVNFAIFSRHATGVRLDLFASPDDAVPTRSIVLAAARNRTGDIWHVWLAGIPPGQLYGFRIAGPYAPHEGHRFNPNKLVVDPYATAIAPIARHPYRAAGYDPSSPAKDLSFSDVDNADTAPKCVVTHGDFDWRGRSASPPPLGMDGHLRAARPRLHHRSERRHGVPRDVSRPDPEDPALEGSGRHRGGRQKRLACLIRCEDGPDLYLMFNADTEPMAFALPRPSRPGEWRLAVDTAQPSPRDVSAVGEEGALPNGTSYEMVTRSGVVLVARHRHD